MSPITNINTQSLSGDKMGNRFLILILLLITVVHFSIPIIATWDRVHYHNYLDIVYGKKSWDNWDVIRGPVFPVLIAFAHLIFGYSHIGMLLWAYLVTLMVFFISVRLLHISTDYVFDGRKEKIKEAFKIPIRRWQEALEECIGGLPAEVIERKA